MGDLCFEITISLLANAIVVEDTNCTRLVVQFYNILHFDFVDSKEFPAFNRSNLYIHYCIPSLNQAVSDSVASAADIEPTVARAVLALRSSPVSSAVRPCLPAYYLQLS